MYSPISRKQERYIKYFAKIARPLFVRTSGKVKFERTKLIQKSFDTLKQALATALVLACSYFSKLFLVAANESHH